MTYLTRGLITAVFITVLIWFATGFVAGTLDMMSLPAGGRFMILLAWLLFQVINIVSWGIAYEDRNKTVPQDRYC